MRRFTGICSVFLVALLLAGCARTTLTNLTPGALDRHATGLYRVEIIWENNDHTVRQETVQPVVLVGTNAFPMQRTALVSNRWETLVPVAAEAAGVAYRIRVDWKFNAVGAPQSNSSMSDAYSLQIRDQ